MNNDPWKIYSNELSELLSLETHPVAINCLEKKEVQPDAKKVRICRSILEAASGKAREIYKENNACFGANWHLGFQKNENPKVRQITKKFVVEGEKLFSSYEALENLIAEMEKPPDNADNCFTLVPMDQTEREPELVIFVCNPEQACRLLTFVTFFEGKMPSIKIGGPTCRMAVIYPLVSKQMNISFQDYAARQICKMDKNQLLVSMPYKMIPKIVENIDKCLAGTAKKEYPEELKVLMQRRRKLSNRKMERRSSRNEK